MSRQESLPGTAEVAPRSVPPQPGRRRRRPSAVTTGRLKVHDPFELIRWLALSQPDPRKALAELVQNSLDAGARTIRVTRVRDKGVPCLRIWDDGEGVIPELERPEALRYIATHVGHSRKRSLTPQQRLELLTQGQYGIGLLGFWSLGEMLELRSSYPGHRAHRLILYRDRPDYTIEPLRGRLPLGERWTEVVVAGLHRDVLPTLVGSRAADYLAGELRGQLLAREVRLVVEDKMARGRARKVIRVKPRRFLGEPLAGIGPLPVEGYPPVQLEVYLVGEEREGGEATGLAVYSAGTLVAESFHELASLGLDHLPWTDPRLTGFVEFPSLKVPPGSRRGVYRDDAAGAFVRALLDAEATLLELLEGYEQRRAEELDRALIRDLQRAFRDFYRQRPSYTLLEVAGSKEDGSGAPAGDGERPETPPAEEGEEAVGEAVPPLVELFPPGPLAELRLVPRSLRLEYGARRRVRARALDAAGRPVDERVSYEWSLPAAVGRLEVVAGSPATVEVVAGERRAAGPLVAAAVSRGGAGRAEASVEVVEELPPPRSDEGIPEPELVDYPSAGWRSRIVDGRWQVNAGHPEYRKIADRPALKLRYLALLFAKEVVLKSSQDPRLEAPLEQLIEIAAYADRQLHRRGRRRRKGEGE